MEIYIYKMSQEICQLTSIAFFHNEHVCDIISKNKEQINVTFIRKEGQKAFISLLIS